MDVTTTTPILSRPSPASVPAAIMAASPGPGIPAPVVTTSRNKMMYSVRFMAGLPAGLADVGDEAAAS